MSEVPLITGLDAALNEPYNPANTIDRITEPKGELVKAVEAVASRVMGKKQRSDLPPRPLGRATNNSLNAEAV